MADARKSAEALRQIQEIQRRITGHHSNISRIERERAEKAKYFEQQIRSEQDRVKQCTQQIEQLKRQI